MGEIDMVNAGIPISRSGESEVQSGGGGGQIEMLATPLPMSHTPVSSAQKGGASAGIDMVGEQGLLDKTATSTFGAPYPTDKGK